jgi:hypothetical protein
MSSNHEEIAAYEYSQPQFSVLQDLIAGTIAGCGGILVGAPADTVKIRLQTSNNASYNSTWACSQSIMKKEGLSAFYKGITPPLLAAAPINAILFASNGYCNRFFSDYFPNSSNQSNTAANYTRLAISGGVGGMAACVASIPAELIKCKMQAQVSSNQSLAIFNKYFPALRPVNALQLHSINPYVATLINTPLYIQSQSMHARLSLHSHATHSYAKNMGRAGREMSNSTVGSANSMVYKSSIDCARHIYSQEGLRGLYRGGLVTAARDIPACAAYFTSYEAVKRLMNSKFGEKKTTNTLVAGAAAGVLSWLVVYPLDCVKSVIQTSPSTTNQDKGKNLLQVIRREYNNHGIKFFFRGLTPTILRAVPVNAITFLIYEKSLEIMQNQC